MDISQAKIDELAEEMRGKPCGQMSCANVGKHVFNSSDRFLFWVCDDHHHAHNYYSLAEKIVRELTTMTGTDLPERQVAVLQAYLKTVARGAVAKERQLEREQRR